MNISTKPEKDPVGKKRGKSVSQEDYWEKRKSERKAILHTFSPLRMQVIHLMCVHLHTCEKWERGGGRERAGFQDKGGALILERNNEKGSWFSSGSKKRKMQKSKYSSNTVLTTTTVQWKPREVRWYHLSPTFLGKTGLQDIEVVLPTVQAFWTYWLSTNYIIPFLSQPNFTYVKKIGEEK